MEIDIKKVVGNKLLVSFILILISMSFAYYYRAEPARLSVTEKWAESTMEDNIKSQIHSQLVQEYPNLPKEQLVDSINKEYEAYKQSENFQSSKHNTAEYFKSRMQNEEGETYLLAIDPYYWYAKGLDIMGESEYQTRELRNGRLDKPTGLNLHPYFSVIFHKITSPFTGLSFMGSLFYMPIITIMLAIIPCFFITQRYGGNIGAFFASMILALNHSLLGRTAGGFADNDAYNILFPLLIVWMIMLAWFCKDIKKRIAYTSLAGLFLGAYCTLWGGWSHILLLMTGILTAYAIYRVIRRKKSKRTWQILVGFVLSSAIFVSLRFGINTFIISFLSPLEFPFRKEVAVKTLWPNVLTTVAEFNEVAFSQVINHLGGMLFFTFAVVGIILMIWKKKSWKYPLLITAWFVATTYSFTQGVRFALLAVPSFAILVGIGMGMLYQLLYKFLIKQMHINKIVAKSVLILALCLLLITPLNTAKRTSFQEVPSMNDAWHDSLMVIHDDSEDAIITSWWDFGHWFYSISQRRVTFDGGSQKKFIYWVGRSLWIDNETQSVNILKMLNCGQDSVYNMAYEDLGTEKEAIDVINEQVEEGFDMCKTVETLPHYFIVSEDMVGKAGVWGHFGSWDFDRAEAYQAIKNMDYTEGIDYLIHKFEVDVQEADEMYYNIQTTEADKWITGWPTYQGGESCSYIDNNTLQCDQVVKIDMEKLNITFADGTKPSKFSYLKDNETFVLKEFESGNGIGVSLLPGKKSVLFMEKSLTGSMFNRLFFYDGIGLDKFELFHHTTTFQNQNIYVYKVQYD